MAASACPPPLSPSCAVAPMPATPAIPLSTSRQRRRHTTVPGVGSHRSEYVTAPEHVVGFGGLIGGARLGFGVTGRAWLQSRIGVQMEASRYSSTDAAAPNRLTSTRLAPAVLYALADRLSDYVWLRPYLGAGMTFRQQTLKDAGTSAVEIASERKSGPRVLGGGEMTFSSMPSLALSADVGYEWPRSTFAGVDAGGPVFSISARYVRRVQRDAEVTFYRGDRPVGLFPDPCHQRVAPARRDGPIPSLCGSR